MRKSNRQQVNKEIEKIINSDSFKRFEEAVDVAADMILEIIAMVRDCAILAEELANDIDTDTYPNNQKHQDCLNDKYDLLDEAANLLEDSDIKSSITDLSDAIEKMQEALDA